MELCAGDPEDRRGLRLITFGVIQSNENGALLQVGQRLGSGRRRWLADAPDPMRIRCARQIEMGRREKAAIGQDQRALDGVRQFADVARPPVDAQSVLSVTAQSRVPLAEPYAELPNEMVRQQQNVIAALPQGREMHA